MKLFAREDSSVLLMCLAIGPALATLSLLTKPDARGFGTHEQLGLPACGLRALLEVPCPACGVTTSVVLATRGRVLESLANQPFGFLLALTLVALFVAALRSLWTGADMRPLIAVRPGWQISVAGLLVLVSWGWKVWGM
ncbi:MAG: hypothetical protein ACI841_005038 [Planctomycetota bacterium]|jgi:hypothetical protein